MAKLISESKEFPGLSVELTIPRAGVGRQGGERPDRDNGAHRAANADTMSRRQQTRRTRFRCRAPKRAPAPGAARTPTGATASATGTRDRGASSR